MKGRRIMVYCVSDIHGRMDKFIKILNTINFSEQDELYILGDVIDRGEDGIAIIQYIMSKPNIKLLIGNHEDMMLKFYHSKSRHDFNIWIQNGGGPTIDNFDKLSLEEQENIINYLQNCYLVIPNLKVNNKSFYLTHASPVTSTRSPLIYKDTFCFDVEKATWDRNFAYNPLSVKDEDNYFIKRYKGTYIVFGHTPVRNLSYGEMDNQYNMLISHYNKYIIAIDCGCANNFGRLGCICLNNFKTYYAR